MAGPKLLDKTGDQELRFDVGTGTAASSAVTINQALGTITSEALTTAAQASEDLTLTSDKITASSIVLCSVADGTNTQGIPVIGTVVPAAGSCVIKVENLHASQAFNGTVVVNYTVMS